MRPIYVALALLMTLPPAAVADGLTPDPLAYVSPSRPFSTLHTSLDLDVDLESRHIAGSVTHRMRALRPGVVEVSLNCVELEISSVTVNGQDCRFEYPVAGSQATAWFQSAATSHADERLVIHLPHPLAMGDEFEVRIDYSGHPQKGLYWIRPEKGLPEKRYEVWSQGEGENNRYWIPCNDYPNDKATYEGRFRVEKGHYALSNGRLVSREDKGGVTEFHWELSTPQVSYLIMLAVAKYDVHEEDWNGIPLLYVVPPGTPDETVRRCYGKTADMMEFFANVTGIDYPFEKYAQVVVQNFIYGGMENTTATVMNKRTLHDERAGLTRSEVGLLAHELAHQWWGDMVTCREWSHMWLNEGFATYYQALYREYSQGDDAFRYQVFERHNGVIDRDNTDARPVVTDFFNRTGPRNSANVYIKGSSVLHMLRFLLGDESYHAVIKHYGETHKFDVVETSDLTRAVKDVTGENLDWFFEQWIYLAGHPKYKVSKSWDGESRMLSLRVRQTQETGGLVPLFRMPIDIEITHDGGVVARRVLVERDDQTFYFELPSAPRMVIFDKGDWILKEASFYKPTAEWIYQLEHGDYMSRVRAAIALGEKSPDARRVDALRAAMMADGHYGLRRECALALGRVGSSTAMEALFDGLGVEDARVRLACAEALGGFTRNEKAASRLEDLIGKDRAYGVRSQAVTSLAKLRAKDSVSECAGALKQESDRGIVRNAALEGLVALHATDHIRDVKRYTGPGEDRDYRHTAILSYARLVDRLDDDGARTRAVDYLAPMLDDWYLRTRETVISAMGILADPAAIPHLRRVAANDPLESLRERARREADRITSLKGERNKLTDVDVRVKALEDRIEVLEKNIDEIRHDQNH